MHCLICRVEGRSCALPLEHVAEVMRPLPVERFEPAPPFVLGVSVIRGAPRIVVDAGELLGLGTIGLSLPGARFVALHAGASQAALAVSEVTGTATLSEADFSPLPPLLAGRAPVVELLARLDGELLEVLQSARIVVQAAAHLPTGGAP